MSDEVTKPELDSLLIDARPLDGVLVDVKAGATRGMSREQPGFSAAIKEIFDNHAKIGKHIGILDSQIDELRTLNENLALIDGYLPAVKKLLEVMEESQTVIDNRRHEIIRVVAKTVDAQAIAMKDDSLVAKYERTLDYRSAIANKAAKTRKKNAAREAEAKSEEAAES